MQVQFSLLQAGAYLVLEACVHPLYRESRNEGMLTNPVDDVHLGSDLWLLDYEPVQELGGATPNSQTGSQIQTG